jgi:hypothetical protein
MSLSGKISAGIAAKITGAAVLGGTPTLSVAAADDVTIVNGVTAGKADLAYTATLTVTGSGSTTLTLSDGSLKDPVGDALAFVKVTAIYLKAGSANGNTIDVGGAASHPLGGIVADAASDKIRLSAGARICWAEMQNGFAVGSGSNDQLKFTNNDSADATIDVIIVGRSA